MSRAGGIPAAHGGEEIGGQRVELLDRARIYACGITPYDVTHLGHAATFLWVDTLTRVLRSVGVEVELCRNVTDVDDVLDAAAARAGAPSDAFAAMQQFQFDQDMARLGFGNRRTSPGRTGTSPMSFGCAGRCWMPARRMYGMAASITEAAQRRSGPD